MTKKLAPLHLRQANVRRWLDKRIPGVDGTLTNKQTKQLIKMMNNQDIGHILIVHNKYHAKILVRERNDANSIFSDAFDQFYPLYMGTKKQCKKFIEKHFD